MLRNHGCVITTEIVVATAKGLTKVIDRTRLERYGGPAKLGVPWAKSLLKCMNFTKRRASTKSTNVLPLQERFCQFSLFMRGKPGGATHLTIFLVIGSSVTVQIIGPLKKIHYRCCRAICGTKG